MTSVGDLLCILQNTLDGFVDGPAYKHAHETLIEVRRRFVSHNQRDQEQSARITELEAELKEVIGACAQWRESYQMSVAERDAVRRALGWLLKEPCGFGPLLRARLLASVGTDAPDALVEAALLAAAREGGVK